MAKRPPQFVVVSAAGHDPRALKDGTRFVTFKNAAKAALALGPGASVQTLHQPCQVWQVSRAGALELIRDDTAQG
jgi:hypothetical protein